MQTCFERTRKIRYNLQERNTTKQTKFSCQNFTKIPTVAITVTSQRKTKQNKTTQHNANNTRNKNLALLRYTIKQKLQTHIVIQFYWIKS